MGAELRVVDVEVEDLVAASVGTDVGGGDHVAVPKSMASTDLNPIVVILSRVGEREVRIRGGGVGEIVNKAVNAALPDVFHFHINVGGKFAFQGKAFIRIREA